MARFKYGSLVSEISGSVGSATFQKSSYGNTLRNKPRPRRTNSPSQLEVRQIMMQVHNAWSNLTTAQRTQWAQFIGFAGATIRRDRSIMQTGHSYFLKYNFLRKFTGQTILDAPLYTLLEVGSPTISFSWDDYENGWNVNTNCDDPGDDLWFLLKLSARIPENRSFRRFGLRYMAVPVSDDGNYAMRDLFKSAFGYYAQDGDWMCYEIQYFGITNTMISGIYRGTHELK